MEARELAYPASERDAVAFAECSREALIDIIEELRRESVRPRSLIAEDAAMQELLRLAGQVAGLDSPVLIRGEPGTGKGELARYIAGKSRRAQERLVPVCCTGDQERLERELFGCAPGVDPERPGGTAGLLEQAEGGSLLLDEIGALSPGLQMRIYTLLQHRRFERVGSVEAIRANVRVLALTRYDLRELADRGQFREELFYRLDVVSLRTLPLRERRGDILPITQDLVAAMNRRYGQKKHFTTEALRGMYAYNWPGNIHELRNMVERVMILFPGEVVGLKDLPIGSGDGGPSGDGGDLRDQPLDLRRKLDELEYLYIQKAYQRHGNVRAAAASLCMDPSTFVRKRKKLGELLKE